MTPMLTVAASLPAGDPRPLCRASTGRETGTAGTGTAPTPPARRAAGRPTP